MFHRLNSFPTNNFFLSLSVYSQFCFFLLGRSDIEPKQEWKRKIEDYKSVSINHKKKCTHIESLLEPERRNDAKSPSMAIFISPFLSHQPEQNVSCHVSDCRWIIRNMERNQRILLFFYYFDHRLIQIGHKWKRIRCWTAMLVSTCKNSFETKLEKLRVLR